MSLKNSIWPNGLQKDVENYTVFYNLGTNKMSIPESSSEWPAGNKLISPYVYQNDKLVGFCDTQAFTVTEEHDTVTIDYDYFDADFSSIAEGTLTIIKGENNNFLNIRYGKIDVPFEEMFEKNKAAFRASTKVIDNTLYDENDNIIGRFDTSNITTGSNIKIDYKTTDGKDRDGLFMSVDAYTGTELRTLKLTTFESELSRLRHGGHMFNECGTLTSFISNLDLLESSRNMFRHCWQLSSFDVDMPKLTDGKYMFNLCAGITSFSGNLDSLEQGEQMFYPCTNLTSFTSKLPKLVGGFYMFHSCKLDAPSVKIILESIPSYTSGNHEITIGASCKRSEESLLAFANECGFETIDDFKNCFSQKGWTMTLQTNGDYTSYSLRDTETPIPVYAKIVETEDERCASHTSADESKFYILDYFTISNGNIDDYVPFSSLNEAEVHFNIKPLERN